MKRHPKLSIAQRLELSSFIGITEDSRESRRAQAVILMDQDSSIEMITLLTALRRRQAFKYRALYLKIGLEALRNKRKGKPKLLLARTQREEVLSYLANTIPKDHGYEVEFWSTSILGHFIKEKYGISYKSKRPFYLLFEEAKYSFHKPGKVYEKRDEVKVEAWKGLVQPKIREAFKDSETVILCEDEMIISTQTTFQKIWLKKGDYPRIEVSNTKKNKSLYGFLNIKTGQEHAFIRERQNMHITTEVLKEIRAIYPNQKILLLWDGAGWHRGSVVQDFIKEDGNIETIYFPPYSPEENPQEHVWKEGRSKITHNKFIPDIDKAASDFVSYLNSENFPYKLLNFSALS